MQDGLTVVRKPAVSAPCKAKVGAMARLGESCGERRVPTWVSAEHGIYIYADGEGQGGRGGKGSGTFVGL